MANKPIVLFDMDGTLTPPREKVEDDMIQSLIRLSAYADVGVLTGSDLEYIMQQIPQISNLANLSKNSIDLLPCNGTKRFLFSKKHGFEQRSTVSMIGSLGSRSYNDILFACSKWQSEIMMLHPYLPFTGTFIQYRGSLLNWCPIGRNAGKHEREQWEKIDESSGIRKEYQEKLQSFIKDCSMNVTVALGGSTSFDIYPDGWDKTYGLTYYGDRTTYFIGDRCKPGGNDWHIYEKLKPAGLSYETSGPQHTLQIIEDIISKLSKN